MLQSVAKRLLVPVGGSLMLIMMALSCGDQPRVYEGYDIDGRESRCAVPSPDEPQACTAIYGPDEVFRDACVAAGNKAFTCGCHHYLCSASMSGAPDLGTVYGKAPLWGVSGMIPNAGGVFEASVILDVRASTLTVSLIPNCLPLCRVAQPAPEVYQITDLTRDECGTLELQGKGNRGTLRFFDGTRLNGRCQTIRAVPASTLHLIRGDSLEVFEGGPLEPAR